MKVSEIFESIDGEGITAGYPTVFIRTFGCNLRCSYCDSMYAVEGKDYTDLTVDFIINLLKENYSLAKRVTLTGGEPLLDPSVYELIPRILSETSVETVNIETNGAISLLDLYRKLPHTVMDNVIITMDWKSKTSGMSNRMIDSNIGFLREKDVLKFVVGSAEDLDQMRTIVQSNQTNATYFVSPVFEKIEPKEIVEYLLKNNLNNVRMQLQMHKFIWPPEMRGV